MDILDDAGVFNVSDDVALIHTVDFFTPIVDDPFTFGQIAAANSLSDIYAMGGKPVSALNIVCFPSKSMAPEVLGEIIKGSIEILHQAEAHLLGGHSVDDEELKYGLAVIGTIRPHMVLTTQGGKAGNKLLLTKPLGTGIINTALKGEMASEDAVQKSVDTMKTLNKTASILMRNFDIHACTDVTGFGLIGHVMEMIQNSRLGMVIDSASVPYIEETKKYADMGLLPGGLHKNRDYLKEKVEIKGDIEQSMEDILYDPQTSGGLLVAVKAEDAENLKKALQDAGIEHASIIGEFTDEIPGRIKIT
jgi:selenide,water dikinase